MTNPPEFARRPHSLLSSRSRGNTAGLALVATSSLSPLPDGHKFLAIVNLLSSMRSLLHSVTQGVRSGVGPGPV